MHTFDPSGAEAAAQGVPGVNVHPVGILGGAAGQPGTDAPEQGQSMEGTMREMEHEWLEALAIDIGGNEWGWFPDFYSKPGATLPVTNLLVTFHMPGDAAEVLRGIDMILADGFRVFSAEQRAGAAPVAELAFVKVSPEGLVCIPHGHTAAQESSLAHLPTGCLNPPRGSIITN